MAKFVVFRVALKLPCLDVPTVNITAEAGCANTLAVTSALKDQPGSASRTAVAVAVRTQVATRARETSSSVLHTVVESDASIWVARSRQLGAPVSVLHTGVGNDVLWTDVINLRNRLRTIV